MSQIRWRIAGASICGVSHEKSGQPCQDAHKWVVLPDGTLISVVADGAGSAEFADVGAATVVQSVIAYLSDLIKNRLSGRFSTESDDQCKVILAEAVNVARTSVEAEAKARNVSPKDLASTLIIAIASSGFVAAAHVGDGAVIASDDSGNYYALTIPKHGEYVNETTFVISPNAVEDMQLIVWRGKLLHLAVLTDGLQMLGLRMPEGVPHAPFFGPLFEFVANEADEGEAREELVRFLRLPRLRDRADDDLTLFLASIVE